VGTSTPQVPDVSEAVTGAAPKVELPPMHPGWRAVQQRNLARRAGQEAVLGGAVGGTSGAVGGGEAIYNLYPEGNDETDPTWRVKRALATAGGAAAGALSGGAVGVVAGPAVLGKLNANLIDLIDKRVQDGRLSPEFLKTHPLADNRLRAIMRAMAQDAAPGEQVRVPALISALWKVNPRSVPEDLMALITTPHTKEEMLAALGEGDPMADSKGLKAAVIDYIRALPMGRERREESEADIFAARGRFGQGVDEARMGQAVSQHPCAERSSTNWLTVTVRHSSSCARGCWSSMASD
jgi:hypothetical protein